MGRRTWGPAVVALLGLVVAGCSDPEPRFADPTESASPSPSASDSASAAPLSPQQTALAWIDARNAALQSGDIDAARALATENCKPCAEYVDGIEDIISSGGAIRSDGWTLEDVRLAEESTGKTSVVTGALLQDGGSTVPSAGAEPFRFKERNDPVFFEMKKEGRTWKIDFIFFGE